MIELINANSLSIPLADNCVQMVATSPPYYGLRSYGIGVENGEIGLEQSPAEYIARLVSAFREIWRVLKPDGCVFVNLGDSYARLPSRGKKFDGGTFVGSDINGSRADIRPEIPDGLKEKDMIGIPWRVAFALQADGWWLRSDIVWNKTNPLPESVTDRPTRSHEYIFLLSKSARYYWDQEAVKEDASTPIDSKSSQRFGAPGGKVESTPGKKHIESGEKWTNNGKRHIRSVWTVPTHAFPGAHFATWPPKLVEPMVKAGSRPGDIVLDPFAGSGTTLLVARNLGRSAIGLDLSFDYLHEQARKRLSLDKLKAWTGT